MSIFWYKSVFTILLSIVLVLFIFILKLNNHNLPTMNHIEIELLLKGFEELKKKLIVVGRDREILSRRLNSVVRDLNRLRCELNDTATDSGAWCRWAFNAEHITDEKLAFALADMLINKTVGSFGDGPGEYKTLITNTGKVKSFTSYDGSPFIEEDTEQKVKFLDLTIPQFGLPIFDWVMSLEVAEHIPSTAEDIYLSNIIRHAKEGIILSWAIPGQTGHYHINTRSHQYVEEKMHAYCFEIDQEQTNKSRMAATESWLQNNLMVFWRKSNCPIDIYDL